MILVTRFATSKEMWNVVLMFGTDVERCGIRLAHEDELR
jgi:hypothetical protein